MQLQDVTGEITPKRPAVTTGELKNFTPKQVSFLNFFGRKDILILAKAFDKEIDLARFNSRQTRLIFSDSCLNGDPYLGEYIRSMDSVLAERAVAYLSRLERRKIIFLSDPVGYRVCKGCEEVIPIERQWLVPVCIHCAKCKNHTHNGN